VGDHVRNQGRLGFDELMIVNPGSSGEEVIFLGADGTLYQVQGLSDEEVPQGLGRCFLGDDGSLYQVQGFDEDDLTELGQYFLGSDGALYEIVQ
jgi:hypothetical protein